MLPATADRPVPPAATGAPVAAPVIAATLAADRMPRVALIGNPNTGKTTLFNRLCGARAKTSNFPGTTTSARIGRAIVSSPDTSRTLVEPRTLEVTDLPGLYRLSLDVPESRICREVLLGEGLYRPPDVVLVVVDACNLTRNLMLVGELLRFERPVIVALNMVDLAQRRGLTLDADALSQQLGCPVIPIVARRGVGLDELRAALDRIVSQPRALALPRPAVMPPAEETATFATSTSSLGTSSPGLSSSGASLSSASPERARDISQTLEGWADRIVGTSVGGTAAVGSGTDTLTERLDETFTHPIAGLLFFVVIMGGLFYTLFALAQLPMDLIEGTFTHLGNWVTEVLPDGPVRDLIANGIIGGIAGTVVFLPQICLLFFLISILEDTGYLARAAFVMDRVLCRFGLPGHAFVPLLSSHACALPGIMSTRLIPDRRDRLATILVAPFMSCSARLPVYVLLTSMLFVDRPLYAGLAFAGCYMLGGTAALLSALLFRRTVMKGVARPMVLELPSYKMPSFTNALISAKDQGWAFLKTAGTIIMAICIVMWWLSTYPHTEPPAAAHALQAQAAAAPTEDERAALTEQADELIAKTAQANSFAGRLGKGIQPLFAPLGYDWQLTVGVLTSFAAREVFVSTMSVLLGGTDDPDLADQGVIQRIRTAKRDDGQPVFTVATSASALVFFVLAMQCLSTLAVTRKETGGLKWPGVQLVYMTSLAYICAFVTYQGLRLMGVS
jgi:ferrous iron transport protein B